MLTHPASVLTGASLSGQCPESWALPQTTESTIAEKLKEAGYVTGHFGKYNIDPSNPTVQLLRGAGFDEWLSGLNFFDNNPYLSQTVSMNKSKEQERTYNGCQPDFLKTKRPRKANFIVTHFSSCSTSGDTREHRMHRNSIIIRTQTSRILREITLLDQQLEDYAKN